MRKLLLATSFALAAILRAGVAEAQLITPGCTSFSCLNTQANVTNPITTTTTTTTTLANQISADLQGSLLNAGLLAATTTNTWTSAAGGMGSAVNNASLTSNNAIAQTPTNSTVGGAVSMSSSMNGSQGIPQANLNTGANAVQQNSLAFTSVGNGGVLAGFSTAIAAR